MKDDVPNLKDFDQRLRDEAHEDMVATRALVESGALSLAGLVTHRACADDARDAYLTAFQDPDCLKMILNWKDVS